MNTVIQALREHIASQNIRFVFPSETTAGLWARKTCTLGISRSVSAKRFLAWDRFKEEAIQEDAGGLEPVSSVVRKLFAESLTRRNASQRMLKSLVAPEYASEGGIFAPFIAALLPSLSYWEKCAAKGKPGLEDDEDLDFKLVKKEYSSFLERYNFFEPSWEEFKIREGENRYVIFFPELIEDFAEYDALLAAPKFIRIAAEKKSGTQCHVYQSVREELRSAVLELRSLHEEEGLPYEEMAVSVPELEKFESALLKEFSLHHVPVTYRAGKKLGETGAGRFFSLVSECAAFAFSFNSLKALVLNDHVPWKDRKKNETLIGFGIKNNCVSSYVQDGRSVDIWEEAFREAWNSGGMELQPYYRELKKRILALAGAVSFAEIRKQYFAFRNGFLDMANISAEDDAVLSRCVEELGNLVELEEKFNDSAMVPPSPLSFFLQHLEGKEYVKANQKPGVNIFRWRVAAASPFACHYVLNASQNAASVLYQPLKFLRQDKRRNLGLEDRDASASFFQLCDTGEDTGFKCLVRISASAQTFSGWAIPHCFFARGRLDAAPGTEKPDALKNKLHEDPWAEERRFWKEKEKLQKIYPLQKRSYESWKGALVQKKNNFSFFASPFPAGTGVHTNSVNDQVKKNLESAILGRDNLLTVTPTLDLNVYYRCPVKWLYSRIFKAKKFTLEAELLDDTSLGILYHKILEKLYSKIKDEDGVFDSRRLDTYKNWALEITRAAIKEYPAFSGPLAVPLVFPQSAGMTKKIVRILSMDAKYFDLFRVAELELKVSLKAGMVLITGIIDRVSVSRNGVPVILDYKTNLPNDIAPVLANNEITLAEFQMPLYVKLYEEQNPGAAVQGAFFCGINSSELKPVMGEKSGGRTRAPDRSEYAAYLEAAEKQIEKFSRKVKDLDFVPEEIRFKKCFDCVYRTACRSLYF